MSFTIRFDNGDIEVDSTGGQKLITDAEKAAQDILDEILRPYEVSTDKGNELFLRSGEMNSVVGNPMVGANTIKTWLKSSIQRVMRAQSLDPGTSRAERIQTIESIVVTPVRGDPTAYAFSIVVVVDDQRIGLARAIRMGHLDQPRVPTVGGRNQ